MLGIINLLLTAIWILAGSYIIAAVCLACAIGCIAIDIAEARSIARSDAVRREAYRKAMAR